MHRFTDPYTTFYTTTSQSPVHQGFSHYFSITQTTYTSRPITTFVQHSTSPQSFHRYTYALNNPLRYKDPSGEAFIADDVLAAVIGGVLNVVVNRHYISSFGDAFGYFTIGAMGGVLNYYTFGIAGSALVAYYNGSMQGLNSTQITRNVISSAVGGAVSYGSIALMGVLAPNYDNISNLAGRYAAKVGYSAFSGFVSGVSSDFARQVSLSVMDPNYDPSISSFWRSGFMGAAISGGLAAGFSVYDYFTWDRYTPEQKMEILNNEYIGNIKYMSELDYLVTEINKHGIQNIDIEQIKSFYNNHYGITLDSNPYIFDKGLSSLSIAKITYMHENAHALQYLFMGKTIEAPAFYMESFEYNPFVPYRYLDFRYGSYYTNSLISNYLFNIIR